MTRSKRRGARWGLVLGLVVGVIALPTSSASGFSLISWDPDDGVRGLDHALRWSATDNAFVDTGSRGLGGGLEYAIDDQFCDWMKPYVADEPAPSCEDIESAVGRAFDNWGTDHPDINFVNVSDDVPPRLATRESPNGGGAEIDVFASKRFQEHNPRNQDAGAYARWKSTARSPRGTNGERLPGGTLTGVDIVVDTRRCWYIDPELTGTFETTCSYFPGLMMHEIGHTLGLSHPHESPNYHSGDDPTQPIEINCENPQRGLEVIDDYDAAAIMARGYSSNYFHRQLGYDRAHLRPDDLGGRNFLYPVCDGASEAEQTSADVPGILGLVFGVGLVGVVRRLR